jgi:hypothetical protein
MKNSIKTVISTILILALVIGCFAAMPLKANAASAPVKGNPEWKTEYSKSVNMGHPAGALWNRDNAAGDKITSNAHSADYDGLYFYWDDKQKDDGVLLVREDVFDLFKDGYTHAGSGISFAAGDNGFVLTAKNSNNYWGYKIAKSTGKIIDTVNGVDIYAYAIPKQIQYLDSKGKSQTESLKNINMVFIDGNYKDAKFDIVKNWFNEEGNPITDRCVLDSQLKLNGYVLGENVVKITDYATAMNGKKITVTEIAPAGFIEKCGKASQTIVAKWNVNPTVTFNNQKQYAEVTIVKNWLDFNGEPCAAPFTATFEFKGATVSAVDNNKYTDKKVKEGQYTIKENEIEGFDLISICGANSVDLDAKTATINVAAGGKYTITFTNQDPYTPPTGTIALTKTVEGVILTEWTLPDGYDKAKVLGGIIFTLHEASGDHTGFTRRLTDPTASSFNFESGVITFDVADVHGMAKSLHGFEGWYVVEEGFVSGSLAEAIFVAPEPLYIYVYGDGNVICKVTDFDYEAYYTIGNGYGSGYVLGYPGLNNLGDIFPITVTNVETGETYDSFCANAGSTNFFEGPGNYMVAYSGGLPDSEHDYIDFVKAYNYIEKNYGTVAEYRAVTQIVTWYLLDAIDIESEAFANINWAAVEAGTSAVAGIPNARTIVLDVIANYESYNEPGPITDVVFMVGKDNADFKTAQPQLVPLYGEHVFNNRVRSTFDVSFTKTKYGGLLSVAKDEFGFELWQFNAETEQYDIDCGIWYTDANGEVTATGLVSGKYVFWEVWTLVFDGGLGFDDEGNTVENYNLVWKAIYPGGLDGLYFEISDNGKITWCAYDDDGNPTVNNEIYGKHTILWAPDGYNPVDLTLPHVRVIELGEGNGKIIYITDLEWTMEIVSIVYPTCERRGIVWLGCNDGTGTGIEFGVPCAHDHVYLSIVADGEHDGWVWFGGQNGCVCGGMEINLEAWYALGGYEF